MYYQYENQKTRRKLINEAMISIYRDDFENCMIDKWNKWGLKEHTFLIFALAECGNKYNRIIEKIFDKYAKELDDYHTFLSFMFIHIILKYESVLPESVCLKMKKHIKNNIVLSMDDCWDFIGVNDNTPAMIAASLILSGEYFGERDWIECGKNRLEQLDEMLERREFLSEFNSPTYTPITMCAMALVGEFSKVCSALALKIESKLWKQFLETAYQPVSNSVGAFSRAYTRDKLCETHNSRAILYMVFGDKMRLNPLNTVFDSTHNMDEKERIFMQVCMIWICSFNYHCLQEYADEFLNRKYPYVSYGKAELSSSYDTYLLQPIGEPLRKENLLRNDVFEAFKTNNCFDYPSSITEISTYMTDKYALGTCTVDFHSGIQTDSFTLYYTNGCTAERQDEIGAIYCNYCINEEFDLRNDTGKKIAFQKDNHAMVLYSPTYCSEEVQEAKLSIIFSNYKKMIRNIVVDNINLNVNDLTERRKIRIPYGDVFIKMNTIFCHVHPLVNNKDIEKAFLEIDINTDNMILNIYNYSGESYNFYAKELRSITNGFVFNVEEDKDMTFEDFVDEYKKSTVEDKIICNLHTRYSMMREVKYECGDTKLSCCISPLNSGIKYISVK